jgi:hypothetical protein
MRIKGCQYAYYFSRFISTATSVLRGANMLITSADLFQQQQQQPQYLGVSICLLLLKIYFKQKRI